MPMPAASKVSLIASGISTNLTLGNCSSLSYHIIDSSSTISLKCGVCFILLSTNSSTHSISANFRGIRGSFRKWTSSSSLSSRS
ncbi:uncharacterized protein K444DRAFT_185069 [Hyaloscypha bicolor E]|uniref:Uncharacterized protein n=1 Tax=Hyaloscypha bicolor E TaxID=1095630 RepID=A0A2J6TRP4_9HELO|nr:uncharacterized protein K444DRAFT_185069 [Hyaloscypha bicolor E]PMD65695.1 hypothetical protein K444DRAFT_185069 [Hyaloscypha bicolor E]